MTRDTATPIAQRLLAGLLAGLLALPALAQDDEGRQDRDPAPPEPESQLRFEDDATSENNELLERMLEQFPETDTNEDGLLDAEEARAFFNEQRERWNNRQNNNNDNNNRRRRGPLRPTHDDVAYGPDEKHRLDLYLARSGEPTPLVVFFHGGQFITGDEGDTGTLDISDLLNAGISVASVDYRTTNDQPFPAPFEDAAQAVQFLRFYAKQYNLDPARFGGHGEEAGGNLALYLALHDDLAKKPDGRDKPTPNTDGPTVGSGPAVIDEDEPVVEDEAAVEAENDVADEPFEGEPWERPELATMSTRLVCAVARHPIASFDPRAWAQHELPMNGHERMMNKYLDVRYLEPLEDEDVIALVEDVSPLALVSPGDPELLLMSQYPDLELTDDTVWIIMAHHPRQSRLIAAAMRAEGNQATVRYSGMEDDPGISSVQFFVQKLK